MGSNKAQADQQEFDPKYEWQENAANFLLKLHLSGFRKEDFRVQVDGAGRLTVRGQRIDVDGNKQQQIRFHKVFQLPPTSNLEDISGRFDAGVLSLTVPKRPAPSPPATIDKQQPQPGKEKDKEAVVEKQQDKQEEEANKKPQQEDPKKKGKKAEQEHKEEAKPTPAPVAVDRKQEEESLLDRVKRHAQAQEERAKAAGEEAAELQSNNRNRISAWKERVVEELHGLATSDWADTLKKNKEVIAVAVAAFSLGLFVSTKLRSRNNN